MITVDSYRPPYILFWYDGMDGDALVEDGKVIDAQINHNSVDLRPDVKREIEKELQNWFDSRYIDGIYRWYL